jgi:G3E family GTPase
MTTVIITDEWKELEMGGHPRTQLVLVCGVSRQDVRRTGDLLRGPGAVLVEHDLRGLAEGVVERRVTGPDGLDGAWTALELAHGCISCTVREDLLPLLLRLGRDDTTRRIVLLLDPAMEPESVCESMHLVLPEGEDVTVLDVVDIEGVVAAVDAATWLADATSDDTLSERGMALAEDDERTVAQVVVGQAEFADVLLLAGEVPEGWERVRLDAVLDRLSPRALRAVLGRGSAVADLPGLLEGLPPAARRGLPDDPHGSLLRGQPPLTHEAGVSLVHVEERRPFHPTRLHEAFDVLLTGTVRIRGRVWVASQPETVLWIESAGGGLQIGHAGAWLAAADAEAWNDAGQDRRVGAALSWHEQFGDREQQLVVLAHEATPADLVAALAGALVTDEELAQGEDAWRGWDDPFGFWHTDPCESGTPTFLADDDTRPGGLW